MVHVLEHAHNWNSREAFGRVTNERAKTYIFEHCDGHRLVFQVAFYEHLRKKKNKIMRKIAKKIIENLRRAEIIFTFFYFCFKALIE